MGFSIWPPPTALTFSIEKQNVYLWRIHFDIWQNQYNIVKLKSKMKLKKINKCRKKKKKNEMVIPVVDLVPSCYDHLIIDPLPLPFQHLLGLASAWTQHS